MHRQKKIAIIGAGFSGTATLVQLVRHAHSPLTIYIFEKENRFATGLAYSTTEYQHLLNVPANNLGLYAHQPDDFYNWLNTPNGLAAAKSMGVKSKIQGESFLPRALYGMYLKQIFARALYEARQLQISVHVIQADVTQVTPHASKDGWSIEFTESEQCKVIHIDQVVLATGNEQPNSLNLKDAASLPFPDLPATIWTTEQNTTSIHQLIQKNSDKNIFLLGTGLTMADAILSLNNFGHRGPITALSRNGRLPQSHARYTSYPNWDWLNNSSSIPRTMAELHSRLKNELSTANLRQYDWRSVIDSIRPLTQTIWKNLPEQEKTIFIKNHQSLWNIHRHRIPEKTLNALNNQIQSKQLFVSAGQITNISRHNDHFRVESKSNHDSKSIECHLIIDCTGPNLHLKHSCNALLQNLLKQGLITPGPLGMGVAATSDYKIKCPHTSPLYTLGAPLIGELWECNSIPELRQQARSVAMQLLQ